ncbi:hypothetical protein EVAR_4862_1 [Eumeta japonica]|uniref:ATP-dependent DNA helicase n=1 Tax=Eumeta variegata TaxID=151549 RepID=A0A4C1T1V2_EUMVA|nr:hypothetical protein EVAR_4862_1 [Eumeta japonica]
MGGANELLASDFRQILPVVPKATRADEVMACVKRSHLWPSVTKPSLTENMKRPSEGRCYCRTVLIDLLLKTGNGDFLKLTGVDLRESHFSHGQLYMACSRVSAQSSLVIRARKRKTKNIVCKEILRSDSNIRQLNFDYNGHPRDSTESGCLTCHLRLDRICMKSVLSERLRAEKHKMSRTRFIPCKARQMMTHVRRRPNKGLPIHSTRVSCN